MLRGTFLYVATGFFGAAVKQTGKGSPAACSGGPLSTVGTL